MCWYLECCYAIENGTMRANRHSINFRLFLLFFIGLELSNGDIGAIVNNFTVYLLADFFFFILGVATIFEKREKPT